MSLNYDPTLYRNYVALLNECSLYGNLIDVLKKHVREDKEKKEKFLSSYDLCGFSSPSIFTCIGLLELKDPKDFYSDLENLHELLLSRTPAPLSIKEQIYRKEKVDCISDFNHPSSLDTERYDLREMVWYGGDCIRPYTKGFVPISVKGSVYPFPILPKLPVLLKADPPYARMQGNEKEFVKFFYDRLESNGEVQHLPLDDLPKGLHIYLEQAVDGRYLERGFYMDPDYKSCFFNVSSDTISCWVLANRDRMENEVNKVLASDKKELQEIPFI